MALGAPRPGGLAAPAATAVPGRALRTTGGLMAAGALALPVLPEVGVLCPLRRVTGVPCPFCGTTTGVLATAAGDVGAAFAANPAAPLLVAAVVLAWAAWLAARVGIPLPSLRWRRPPAALVVVVVAALWLFQFHRFSYV